MIKNQWYIVLESVEVKQGKPVGVTRMGEKLVFWRNSKGDIVCMGDRCPHMNAPLHKGKVVGDHIKCPFHGFEYDISGQCQLIPAVGASGKVPKVLKAKDYQTYEDKGFIWIWWGENPPDDLQPPPWFESIDDRFSYSRLHDHWNVHYSRSAENQLDMSHLPFVHHNTIGRGQKMIVDGPLVEQEDGRLNVWVMNRKDDGTPPRKSSELQKPDRHPSLQFQFPNYWHNWIADDVRVVIAFVPVDEENNILYIRFYQRVVNIPILRGLVNFVGRYGSRLIACQDKRIVTEQVPKKTYYNMKERLRPSDGAVFAFRKHRRFLKEQAGQVDRQV